MDGYGFREVIDNGAMPNEDERLGDALTRLDEPILDDAALYGPAGDAVRLISPHTEAAAVGVLVSLVSLISACIGQRVYLFVDGSRQYTNLFALLIGPTSAGRKGTASNWARYVMRLVDERFIEKNTASGLSSGEGIAYRLRDVPPETPDAPAPDKRLYLEETEFASVLKKARREGSVLSETIRQCFDSRTLQTLTKGDAGSRGGMVARNPHVSIVGHVTPDELQATLAASDLTNGFLNRFLLIRVKRSRLLAFGGRPDEREMSRVAERIREALAFINQGEVGWSGDAHSLWNDEMYPTLNEPRSGRLDDICARGPTIVQRMAMIYAVLDRERHIHTTHLRAASAIWKYSEATARHLYAERPFTGLAEKMLAELEHEYQKGKPLTLTQLRWCVGGKNVARSEWDTAIKQLEACGRVHFLKVKTAGRARITVQATDRNKEKEENKEISSDVDVVVQQLSPEKYSELKTRQRSKMAVVS